MSLKQQQAAAVAPGAEAAKLRAEAAALRQQQEALEEREAAAVAAAKAAKAVAAVECSLLLEELAALRQQQEAKQREAAAAQQQLHSELAALRQQLAAAAAPAASPVGKASAAAGGAAGVATTPMLRTPGTCADGAGSPPAAAGVEVQQLLFGSPAAAGSRATMEPPAPSCSITSADVLAWLTAKPRGATAIELLAAFGSSSNDELATLNKVLEPILQALVDDVDVMRSGGAAASCSKVDMGDESTRFIALC